MNEKLFDLNLALETQKLFVKKQEVDFSQDNVVAAIATAASKIATVSEKAAEELVMEQILDLYGKKDSERTSLFIGMGPQYVKSNIGYDVDFNDYNALLGEYTSNKVSYDTLFNKFNYRSSLNKENPIK